MDKEIIKKGLCYDGEVLVLEETPSTNTYSLENKLKPGDIVVAKKQTQGKGRTGKQWISNTNSIAVTISVNPDITPTQLTAIPLIFGVAVCNTIKEVSGLDAKIKWPNDIVYNKKKLCGILCEAKQNSVVCGAGINVNDTEFPEEIKNIATSLKAETNTTFDRNEIIYKVANNFNKLISNGYTVPKEFADLCVNIGKDIIATVNGEEIKGRCKGIDETGALIVTTDNGDITISSGDVSVRGFYGYY